MTHDIERATSEIAQRFANDHGQDIRERYYFPNGRGVSIIRTPGSYGYRAGSFEVAVLDADGVLDYSTPVTDDVIGWLSADEVMDVVQQVAELPPAWKELEN